MTGSRVGACPGPRRRGHLQLSAGPRPPFSGLLGKKERPPVPVRGNTVSEQHPVLEAGGEGGQRLPQGRRTGGWDRCLGVGDRFCPLSSSQGLRQEHRVLRDTEAVQARPPRRARDAPSGRRRGDRTHAACSAPLGAGSTRRPSPSAAPGAAAGGWRWTWPIARTGWSPPAPTCHLERRMRCSRGTESLRRAAEAQPHRGRLHPHRRPWAGRALSRKPGLSPPLASLHGGGRSVKLSAPMLPCALCGFSCTMGTGDGPPKADEAQPVLPAPPGATPGAIHLLSVRPPHVPPTPMSHLSPGRWGPGGCWPAATPAAWRKPARSATGPP